MWCYCPAQRPQLRRDPAGCVPTAVLRSLTARRCTRVARSAIDRSRDPDCDMRGSCHRPPLCVGDRAARRSSYPEAPRRLLLRHRRTRRPLRGNLGKAVRQDARRRLRLGQRKQLRGSPGLRALLLLSWALLRAAARYTVERATPNHRPVPRWSTGRCAAATPGVLPGVRVRLGLLTPQLTFGHPHPFPGPHPDQISLGDHGQHVAQQPPDRVGRVIHRPAQAEPDLTEGEFLSDRAGIRQPAGQAIQLGDDQGVPGPAGSQSLAWTGPVPVGASRAVIDVHPARLDTQAGKPVTLLVRSCSWVETLAQPMSGACMTHLQAGPI